MYLIQILLWLLKKTLMELKDRSLNWVANYSKWYSSYLYVVINNHNYLVDSLYNLDCKFIYRIFKFLVLLLATNILC